MKILKIFSASSSVMWFRVMVFEIEIRNSNTLAEMKLLSDVKG
jgi:hypothetical protein